MTNFDESRYIVKAKIDKQWKKEFKQEDIQEDWVQGCLVINNDKPDSLRY